MPKVLRARCPGCQRQLQIPEAWLNQTVRCKHCGAVANVVVKPPRAAAFRPQQPPTARTNATEETRDRVLAVDKTLDDATTTRSDLSESGALPSMTVGDSEPIIRTSYQGGRTRPRWRSWLIIPIFVGIASAAGVALWQFWPLKEPGAGDATINAGPVSATTTEDYPRRLLGICVHNHLYANTVSYGASSEDFHDLLDRMVHALHIPLSQALELSDGATEHPTPTRPASTGRRRGTSKTPPPLSSRPIPLIKPVLEKSITAFLDSSRAQDRIILLFTGHVVEIGDEAHLVPLDGELSRRESLIPMTWLLDQLAKCPARQRILILDSCRLDPGRGLERPGSGPMGKRLDALTAAPPEGVEIWSSCSLGQFSYEYDGNSLFLSSLFKSLGQPLTAQMHQPQDHLPVKEWAEHVNPSTTALAEHYWKAKQTPRLAGKENPGGAPYDPQEPAPPKWDVTMPATTPGTANPMEVRSIVQEISLPPIRQVRGASTQFFIDPLVSFSAKTLEPYKPDYRSLKEIENHPDQYPLRAAVLNAIKIIEKDFSPEYGAFGLQESFAGGNEDKLKDEVQKMQVKPAKIIQDLTEALATLEQAGQDRSKEKSKRWQAHYDFVHADLIGRIAHVYEYDLMLGRIRTGSMPIPDGGMPTGWRMASQEKMQGGKDRRDEVAQSRKILDKLARDHPGTPWEVLAKRTRLTALGLKWEPIYE